SRELRDKLVDSHLARARAGRWSRRPGQRYGGLEALAEAATIRPSPELRDEAIACMALVDLRLARRWKADKPGVPPSAFAARLRRYVHLDDRGNIPIRRVADDSLVVRLTGPGMWGRGSASWPWFSPDGRYVAATYVNLPAAGEATLVWDTARGASDPIL